MTKEHGRYLADNIPGARYAELAGSDHWIFTGNSEALLDEVEEFLTGVRSVRKRDRVLATLFTDIVASTERVAEIGDRRCTHAQGRSRRVAPVRSAVIASWP